MSDDHNTNTNTPKPHNYYDELTPAQQEEWAKISAAAAEAKKVEQMDKDHKAFNKAAKAEFTGGNGDAKGSKKETKGKKAKANGRMS